MRPVLGKSEGDGAWRRLWAAWQQARAGAGSMVALAGDPGMGKSHLLGVLADRVRPAAQVRWVSASDPPSGTPYALLADAFDTERFPDSLDGHEAGRLIRERLSAQADNSAVLVVLDDLHVADEPSLRALRYLAAHMPAGEVLVAVGYRPRQASAALLRILPARSAAVVLEPVPEAIAAEIAGCADARLAELRRFCEGNPLYLSALADQPGHEAAGSRHGELLRAWVRAELTRDLGELSATARVVAQAAAVAGERAELGLLQGICRIDEDQVLAAVDELAGADVLRAAGPCYAFRHPLVGRAVLESTGPSWRIAAHRRALELLRERKAPVEELARHLEWLPADGGREQADLFAAAGAAALADRPALAGRWFGLAVDCLTGAPDDRRAGLLLAGADAAMRVGRLSEAYTTAHDVLGMGIPRLRCAATRLAATAVRLLGRGTEAAALLRDVLHPDGRVGAELAVDLVLTEQAHGSPAELDKAAEGFAEAGLKAQQAAAHAAAALVKCASGREFDGDLTLAGRLVDELPDVEFVHRLDLLVRLSEVEQLLEHRAEARRHSGRAAAIARASGQIVPLAGALIVHGTALGWLGRTSEGAAALDEAVAVLAGRDCAYLRGQALAQRAWLAARVHGTPPSPVMVDEAVELTSGAQFSPVILRLAALRISVGADGEQDARRFLRLAGGPELPAIPAIRRPEFAEALVAAAVALGRPDFAMVWSERLLELVAGPGLPGRRGLALAARARALLVNGNREEAAACAAVAAVLLEQAGARTEASRARGIGDTTPAAAPELPARAPMEGLTRRETEIAELVTTGATNAQIARRLRLSEKTIEGHLTRTFGKLNVPSRAALASMLTRVRLEN